MKLSVVALLISLACGITLADQSNTQKESTAAPPILGCTYEKDNFLTGFYEYNCSTGAKISGTSTGGKCQSGSLNMYKTSFYCLTAETSSNLHIMLKCPGTWNPDPKNSGGFICNSSTQNNDQNL